MKIYVEKRIKSFETPDKKRLKEIFSAALQSEEKSPKEEYEISVIFVSRDEIRAINSEYRSIDRATDIISFAFQEGEGSLYAPLLLGDLIISPEIVAEHAAAYGVTFEREMTFVLVHGILHLLGHEHTKGKGRREKMRAKEEAVMNILFPPD